MAIQALDAQRQRNNQTDFREFLTEKLSYESAATPDRIYHIIGNWYRANQEILEVIADSDNAESNQVYSAIRALPQNRLEEEVADYIIQYLDSLPEAQLEANPWITFSKGAMLLNNLRVAEAKALFKGMAASLEDHAEYRTVLGEVYLMLGDISIIQNSDAFAYYYRSADMLLPGGSTQRRPPLPWVDNCDTLFLPPNKEGELARMVAQFKQSMPVATRVMNGCGHGMDLLFETEAAYHTARYGLVPGLAQKTIIKAQAYGQSDIVCNAYFIRLKTAYIQGNLDAACRELSLLERYVADNEQQGLMMIRDCARAWLYAKTGEADRIPSWITGEAQPVSPPPISEGRTTLVVAAALLQKQQYAETIAFLDSRKEILRTRGQWIAILQAHIIKAIALFRNQERETALAELKKAVKMAHPNNIITPFAEFGNDICVLAQYAMKSGQFRYYITWLDNVCRLAGIASTTLRSSRADLKREKTKRLLGLTNTDCVLLAQMAAPTDQRHICAELNITPGQLKRAAKDLYDKLEATNSRDAVATAIAMGVIS